MKRLISLQLITALVEITQHDVLRSCDVSCVPLLIAPYIYNFHATCTIVRFLRRKLCRTSDRKAGFDPGWKALRKISLNNIEANGSVRPTSIGATT